MCLLLGGTNLVSLLGKGGHRNWHCAVGLSQVPPTVTGGSPALPSPTLCEQMGTGGGIPNPLSPPGGMGAEAGTCHLGGCSQLLREGEMVLGGWRASPAVGVHGVQALPSLPADESSLKMNHVEHIPQSLASHSGSYLWEAQQDEHGADMLKPDPRDTFFLSKCLGPGLCTAP